MPGSRRSRAQIPAKSPELTSACRAVAAHGAAEIVAAVEILLGLSRVAAENDEIVSIDINPLIIADGHPVAVDALVEVQA